jgi:hypothetical protein
MESKNKRGNRWRYWRREGSTGRVRKIRRLDKEMTGRRTECMSNADANRFTEIKSVGCVLMAGIWERANRLLQREMCGVNLLVPKDRFDFSGSESVAYGALTDPGGTGTGNTSGPYLRHSHCRKLSHSKNRLPKHRVRCSQSFIICPWDF